MNRVSEKWRSFWARHRKLSRLRAAVLLVVGDLTGAIARSWWRVVIALLAGILLVINKDEIANHTVASISEHIGIGLIVAGIAVFGYEFRSTARELLERIDRLQLLIDIRGKDALAQSLAELLPDARHSDNAALRTTVHDVVCKMHWVETANPWNVNLYVSLMSAILEAAAINVKIVDSQAQEQYWCTLRLPTPESIADAMLSALMLALGPNDKYDVLSDFTSWDGSKLTRLAKANDKKSMEGISIRRVFCIFDHDYKLPVENILAIAENHWTQAKREGSAYRVGFAVAHGSWKHQGIFIHGDSGFRFEPDEKLEFFQFFKFGVPEVGENMIDRAWQKVDLDSAINVDADWASFGVRLRELWNENR